MTRSSTIFAALATAIVLATAATGIVMLEAPSDERRHRADRERLRDLRSLAGAVADFHDAEDSLPVSLDALHRRFTERVIDTADPLSGDAYGYSRIDAGRYELCATFEAPSPADADIPALWRHGSGYHCFALGDAPPG